MEKDKVIDFSGELKNIDSSLDKAKKELSNTSIINSENDDLIFEIEKELGIYNDVFNDSIFEKDEIAEINSVIDQVIIPEYKDCIKISALDTIVSISSGIIASIIDIVFVGTPEVVKIYKGGENFDGSILTEILRKIGNGDDKLSKMFHILSDKCKVPYDISISPGVVIPDNHRLRGFAHDPFFGLLFAVADIIMGTTTTIDNDGKLRILVNDNSCSYIEKYLSVFYFFGHILSDICTARGIPIPGFALTQFFTDGDSKKSLARIAEDMYKDGYDMRHLVSMSTPVVVKNLIIDLYIRLRKIETNSIFETITSKELSEQKEMVYKYKLRLMSDAVACGGNVLKFFIPPTTGNWTALNLPEWQSLICNTINDLKYELRDKDFEKAIFNREVINDNWGKLI